MIFGGRTSSERNKYLPAVCGRVCPQEKQCEEKCFYKVSL
jgi:NADPH-dependent glutamate synthase beta subunit-like oxidoreductase